MQISVEPISRFSELFAQLNESDTDAGVAAPMLSECFLGHIVSQFGSTKVRVLVGRQQGDVVMLLLVVRKAFGVFETFCPSQLTVTPLIAGNLILDKKFLRQCGAALGSPVMMLTVFNFDYLAFPKVELHEKITELRPYADTMHIDLSGDFESYWSARSKKLRDNLKRYVSRMEKDGFDVSFVVNASSKDVGAALSRYALIEQGGWKGKQGTAIDLNDDQGQFYDKALRCLAAHDGAQVLELQVDGAVVSSRIVIFKNGKAVFLKTTYNEDFKKYSPGRILLMMTIEHLFGMRSLERVEFYTKVNADQGQWASGTRPVQHLEVYRFGLLRSLRRFQVRLRKEEPNLL